MENNMTHDLERLTTKRQLGQDLTTDEWRKYALMLETIVQVQAPKINDYNPDQELVPVRHDPTKLEMPMNATIGRTNRENGGKSDAK